MWFGLCAPAIWAGAFAEHDIIRGMTNGVMLRRFLTSCEEESNTKVQGGFWKPQPSQTSESET